MKPLEDEGSMESGDVKLLELIFEGSSKPTDVKLSALEIITENFSEDRKIGEGGFATVYRGVLQNGEVAVKRIRNDQAPEEKLFRREVSSLLNVSHKNIVRFIGFCSHTVHKAFDLEGQYIYAEKRDRLICFEYINNGSLEKYVSDELRGLPWDTRYFLIKGICEGLHYLHVEKKIIHMDLKPANILIDNNMVPKITDFGLSRMEKNAEAKTTTYASTPGYTAPEYIDYGKMSVKYDVYSLGVIIIELVTGSRSIPDSNNVVRRWRHRLHKSGEGTPFRYQQIAKLIEIGLLCKDEDPYKRPFIYDITRVINELENTDKKFSNVNNSTVGQISPYLEDDMLGIEPLQLCFPFELNNQISCSLELSNKTNAFMAFSIQTTSSLSYSIQPNKDIVAPGSKYNVNIILQPLDKAPDDKHTGDFIVRSTKVNKSLTSEDITEDIFSGEDGKLVDEVNLTITYKAEVPRMDVSLGSPIMSDMRHLYGLQESNVPPTDAESKTSASISDEVIQFKPPELRFPLVPKKKVLSSIKIINITEYYVSFILAFPERNTAHFSLKDPVSIMPPRSTRRLIVTREEKKDAVKDMKFNDEISVWYAIVTKDSKASDLVLEDYIVQKKLPIVLTKINSCTSNELIQFDPPELSFHCLSKTSLSSVNIVNITDCHIAFNLWSYKIKPAFLETEPRRGIMPPGTTQRVVVKRIPKNTTPEEVQCTSHLFVWNMIVSEDVESIDVLNCMSEEDSKVLPLTIKKTSLNELIQFDPPELWLPQLANQRVLTSAKIVNITDQYIGFRICTKKSNSARYYANPSEGILPPLCTQVLLLTRIAEVNDTQCKDKFLVWNNIVTEDVKASNVIDNMSETKSTELPIVLTKTSSSISDELIQFDPPELHFPFLPNKKVSSSIKIVNLTDYNVGFSTYSRPANAAWYHTEPPRGILPPRSTQKLMVTREEKEGELHDKQFNDKYLLWKSIVSEGMKDSDLSDCMPDQESKELPIVLDKEDGGSMESDDVKLLEHIFDGRIKPTDVKISALETITQNFSEERKIGKGGFGTVYRGVLQNGEVAVKRIRNDQTIDEKLFQREVSSLLNASHKNIVRFIGFCSHTVHKALVHEGEYIYAENRDRIISFEYIKNGSLEQYISDELRGLTWDTRYFIIKGICEGLQYLHMEKHIIHMDLKPTNILVDNNMVAKITNFGLSRMEKNAENKTTTHVSSRGYTAPEYIHSGKMSVKCDVYSLGVIIIELVTGNRSIPDSDNVLRRWRHRLHKSGEGTPFRYQQIAKFIEIGLLCQEKDPYKRPFIYDLIHVINELENTNSKISNVKESTVGQISPYLEDDMLGIEPLELCFPFELNNQISCSLELSNETKDFIAFNIQTTSLLSYCIQPNKDIVAPGSKCSVNITLQPLHKAPHDKHTCDFIVRSTKVNASLISEDITEDIFNIEDDKLVDEVNIAVTYKDKVTQVDVSLGSQIVSDTRLLHSLRESNVPPTEAASNISSLTSDELIRLDPTKLFMPNLPNKTMKCIVNVVNTTSFYVAFNVYTITRNAARYKESVQEGILPPRSTERCILDLKIDDMGPVDDYFVWSRVVTEGVESEDIISFMDEGESMKLPFVLLNTAIPCTSNELIQFDPPELSLPFMPSRTLVFSVDTVNNTDCFVGFNVYNPATNVSRFKIFPEGGVIPPRSTQSLLVKRLPPIKEQKDTECKDRFFLWSILVSEGVKACDIGGCEAYEGSKELPIIYETSLCTSDELIQFDPPQLMFPFLPNKRVSMFRLFKIVNITNNNVGFIIWNDKKNSAEYVTEPDEGVIPAWSTQELRVRRTPKEKETEDVQCKDKIFVWNGIVTGDIEAGETRPYRKKEIKELIVVLTKPEET